MLKKQESEIINKLKNKLVKRFGVIEKFVLSIICYYLKKRNESLLYNMIRMMIYVLIILLLIFLFTPHKAYVVIESDNINEMSSKNTYKTEEKHYDLFFNNIKPIEIDMGKDSELILALFNVIIENDNQTYSGNFYIDIKIPSDYVYSQYKLFFLPIEDDGINIDVSASGKGHIGYPETIKFDNYPIYKIYSITYAYFRIYNSFSIESIYDGQDIEAYIVGENNNTPLKNCKVYFNENSASEGCLDEGVSEIELFHNKNTKGSITVSSLTDISMKCNGKLYFTYIPENMQYNLYHQDIDLHSKDSKLAYNFSYDIKENEYKILINGYVNKAYISENSLFPSFKGWFKTNIYIIPLTLVSTVIGGLALTYNKKRKAD